MRRLPQSEERGPGEQNVMKIVFVSNYINHHQIPFCRAMYGKKGVDFCFIQTEPMEEERVRMGWQAVTQLPYLKLYYIEPEACRQLIMTAEVVLFGGCDEESYITDRLRAGRPVIRISERLYKEAQWKAISPRGLLKKYKDHVRYRKAQVYLLCAGAYVTDDFHIIRAYPDKMYRWGYFPEKKEYDLDQLWKGKGCETKAAGGPVPRLFWAGRFIDWKHPELAVYTAKHLKDAGISFHLDMAGGGQMEAEISGLVERLGVSDAVSLLGFCTPQEVRSLMERADIYLMTSNRKEGWGAVVNEAMNSGCAVIADHMAGAVPYLIRHGENGLIYRDGDKEGLFAAAEALARDRTYCRRLGEEAYRTITEVWNAENAADRLMELMAKLGLAGPDISPAGEDIISSEPGKNDKTRERRDGLKPGQSGPCSPAPVISERRMYRYLMKRGQG